MPISSHGPAFNTDPLSPLASDGVYVLGSTGDTVSGGSYRISYGGQQTSAIAWNASADTALIALNALSTVAPGDIEIVPQAGTTSDPAQWSVLTWRFNYLAIAHTNAGPLTVSASNLTGAGGPVISFEEDTFDHAIPTGRPGDILYVNGNVIWMCVVAGPPSQWKQLN